MVKCRTHRLWTERRKWSRLHSMWGSLRCFACKRLIWSYIGAKPLDPVCFIRCSLIACVLQSPRHVAVAWFWSCLLTQEANASSHRRTVTLLLIYVRLKHVFCHRPVHALMSVSGPRRPPKWKTLQRFPLAMKLAPPPSSSPKMIGSAFRNPGC